MEGEVRDSLILTQEHLDELAAVFKSVNVSLCRCSFWLFVLVSRVPLLSDRHLHYTGIPENRRTPQDSIERPQDT